MNRRLPIGQLPTPAAWREAGGTPELYVACSNVCLDRVPDRQEDRDGAVIVEFLLGQLGWEWS